MCPNRNWAIGDRISMATPELLDLRRIEAFGEVSGDSSPTHLSDEAAHAAHFPAAIAHGILGLAFCGRMIEREMPECKLLSLQARFVTMTFHGDTLSGTGTIESIDIETEEMRLSLIVNNQRAITVLRGTATLLRCLAAAV
jgi:acyl dehydratase